ncbi:MAG: 1,4-alpha-glucan branching protein domain-containing protein [Patulibacter sp.]
MTARPAGPPRAGERSSRAGRLAIVLHSHLPYVEGFGTWPFGEEWLWEAHATSYAPLVALLDRHPSAPGVTLSTTPVLIDQLQAPGAADRARGFLDVVREDVYGREIAGFVEHGFPDQAEALRRQRQWYRDAHRALDGADDLAAGLLRHARWTSSATHAVLPLVASPTGLRAQLSGGIGSHRRRTGRWDGGFWSPECAYSPALDGPLRDAGVATTCVDLTDRLGSGDPRQLQPYRTDAGTTLLPIDRRLIDLVWADGAFPAGAAYRDTHRRSTFDLMPWANDGSIWSADRARAAARHDAARFVTAARERLADGGVATVALDTEFLGHWWLEGVWWLEAVLDEAAAQGLELLHADAVAAHLPPVPLPREARTTTTWGAPRDLSTWSGAAVAELAWRARRLELDVVATGGRATARAWRELLAVQSSDWAFLRTRGTAGAYPDMRASAHAESLVAELHALGSASAGLRNLAPYLDGVPLQV